MADPGKLTAFLGEARNIIVAGIRRDGTPHLSPNWFWFDGEKFYVSTTRTRLKYKIFLANPRAELIVDDSLAQRYVRVAAATEVREKLEPELGRFRAIREKQGVHVPSDEEFLASLTGQQRVLLAFTPVAPPSQWTVHGLD